MYGIWDLKPYCLSPWTLRGVEGSVGCRESSPITENLTLDPKPLTPFAYLNDMVIPRWSFPGGKLPGEYPYIKHEKGSYGKNARQATQNKQRFDG